MDEGFRAAITGQLAQLDRMEQTDTHQPFYPVVPADRQWLAAEITDALLTALRQVVASEPAGLVHALDMAELWSGSMR